MSSKKYFSKEEITALLMEGTVQSFGYDYAYYEAIPLAKPMDYGWIHLRDGDHDLRSAENGLLMDLWFNDYGYQLSNEAIKDSRKIPAPDGSIFQVKLTIRVSFENIKYLHINQKRIWIEWKDVKKR